MAELFANEELALRFIMRRRFNKSIIFTLFRNAIAGESKGKCYEVLKLFAFWSQTSN